MYNAHWCHIIAKCSVIPQCSEIWNVFFYFIPLFIADFLLHHNFPSITDSFVIPSMMLCCRNKDLIWIFTNSFSSLFFLFSYLPSSCILWAWLHFLLPGGKASVLYRSGPRSQLAPVCHGVAPLQCHDDRNVSDLRLQTPLARSADTFRWVMKQHLFLLKFPCDVW